MASPSKEPEMTSHYGKYRGTVVNQVDPMLMGRLLVSVPTLGLTSAWAMPCFPVAGDQAGAWMIPSPGTGVWVEFEEGDVDQPIWSGCWYGSAAAVPPLAREGSQATPPILLQTPGQTTVMLSDTPGPTGGILLQTAAVPASRSPTPASRSPTARAPPSPSWGLRSR